ncbi:MAG: TonB-dependent receptor [Parabacteroides sp.]|nr:TonB-dependent receptor [Parabacteroides sp.]
MRNRILFMLCFLFVGFSAFAQVSISGKVVDNTGFELPGVNVVVKGTTVGTMTLGDGTYVLSDVPGGAKAVIEFSYIGFKPVEVVVGNQKVINVTMVEDSEQLEEVVVVAYGTAKKKDLTGSMSAIDSKVLTAQSSASASKMLEGAAPGLKVASGDGQPGQDMGIRVRGTSSANGNSASALIVIDGVPAQNTNPLSNMNSSDIESITVLKDAASTALYGSRGANGVVLVTTKKGKSGQTRISLDARWGWNSVGNFNTSGMTEASDYYEYYWRSIYNSYRYGVNGTGLPGTDANGYPYTNVHNPNYSHEQAAEFASQHLFNYIAGAANSETNFSRNGLGNYMAYNVPGAIYTPVGSGSTASATMTGAYLVGLDGKINPNAQYLYTDEDTYANQLMRTGFRQQYDISASGGTDKVKYYASLGYLDEPSYVRSSDFKRYTGRVSVDAELYKWLKIGANVSYAHTITNSMSTRYGRNPGAAQGNVMLYANGTHPIVSVWAREKNPDGSIGGYVLDKNGNKVEAGFAGETYSPLGTTEGNRVASDVLFDLDNNINERKVDLWTSRVYADFMFGDFKATVNFSLDQHADRYMRYLPSSSYVGGAVGGMELTKFVRTILNSQQLLSYNKDFGKHHVDALVGHEYNDNSYDQLKYGTADEFITGYLSPANFVRRYSNVSTLGSPGWSLGVNRMESYLARANYIYDDKYYLSGSVRADGSSKFAKDKWGVFYSVGGGWRFTSEEFMEGTKSWLDNAKLRLSYGVIGNQNGAPEYGHHTWSYSVGTWATSTNGTGTAQTYSIGYGALVNEDLTWENVHTTDVGVDFTMFGGRLSGTVDFYNSLTTNSFYNEPVSYLANGGTETRQRNSAKLRNRGFELDLNATIINTKDWTWNVGINGTHYRTVLVSVPETTIPAPNATDDLPDGTWTANGEGWSGAGTGNASGVFYLRGEGRDWYNLYLYKYAGVDEKSGLPMYWHRVTYDDVNNNASGGRYAGKQIGENVKTTVSADASLYELGSATPDWIGGLTTSLRYKDFDLQAIFAYQIGGKFISVEYANGLYRSSYLARGGQPQSTDLIGNTWTPDNQDAFFPMQWASNSSSVYYDGATTGSWKYTDMSLFSASYLRMKNLTLGYTLPKSILNKINVSKLRVYASADNLWYISAKKGIDPAMSMTGGLEIGQYVYPTMRTVSLGLNLEF